MQIFHRLLLILLAASCNNLQTTDQTRQIFKDTLQQSNPIIALKKADTTLPAEDFFTFWKRFRKAILDSDVSKIISMTEFPFQTRGPLDDDPTIKYNKVKFSYVFRVFLNQWNGDDLNGTTELDDIKKNETPKNEIQQDIARVGNLVFSKTDAGWKLSFAYLNNETIDSLKK